MLEFLKHFLDKVSFIAAFIAGLMAVINFKHLPNDMRYFAYASIYMAIVVPYACSYEGTSGGDFAFNSILLVMFAMSFLHFKANFKTRNQLIILYIGLFISFITASYSIINNGVFSMWTVWMGINNMVYLLWIMKNTVMFVRSNETLESFLPKLIFGIGSVLYCACTSIIFIGWRSFFGDKFYLYRVIHNTFFILLFISFAITYIVYGMRAKHPLKSSL